MKAQPKITSDAKSTLQLRKLIDRMMEVDDKSFFYTLIRLEKQRESGQIKPNDYNQKITQLSVELADRNVPAVSKQLLLKTENVVKKYSTFTLGPISITMESGKMIGLVGENGNGKTTLLRMIAQDLSLTSGSISYPDFDYSSQYALRSHIPYVPQRTPKWYGYVRDNLVFCALAYGIPKSDVDVIVDMWMLRFGIWQFRHHKWDALSSGYKMRFELVRNFLRNPRVLVIDEPLANLDVLAQQLILEDLSMLVKSTRYPRGIILSSQQLYNVESAADEVIFLKDGQVKSLKATESEAKQDCVIEIETHNTGEELKHVLTDLGTVVIEEHGVTKVIYITSDTVTAKQVLQKLIDSSIELPYFRDITNSTRRLFSNLKPSDDA